MQYTSAQAIPYGVSNRGINNARATPNGLAMGRGLPNRLGRTMPMTGNNVARGNIMNQQNLANPYHANNYYSNNLAYANQKIANPNLANIVETNSPNPFISASQVLANDITEAAIENLANANIILPNNASPTVIANVPDGATYNFGNTPIPVTVTGKSYGNHPVGIHILADNLEVKGLVTVVGRMPIFGAVTLNGNLPSDGMASVNDGCGSPAAV